MSSCIFVLSYNHPELTARAVKSALNFSDKIILIHNGSEKKHIQTLRERFPDVQHEILFRNVGYSGGVNAGLQAALKTGADWIFLLTNDCELLSLEVPSHLKPCFVAPLAFRRRQDKIDSIGGCFIPEKAHLHHLRSNEEYAQLSSEARQTLKPSAYPYIPGSAFWIHRQVIEEVGWMDESLGTYWEDVDFSVRVFQAGFELAYDDRTRLTHQVGKTNQKNTTYTTYFYQRNRRVVSRRHCPANWRSRLKLWWTLQSSAARLGAKFLIHRDFARLKLLLQALKDSDRMS